MKVAISINNSYAVNNNGGEQEALTLANYLTYHNIKFDFYPKLDSKIEDYSSVIHFGTNIADLDMLSKLTDLGINIILFPNLYYLENKFNDYEYQKIINFFNVATSILFKTVFEKNHILNLIQNNQFDHKIKIIPPLLDDKFFENVNEEIFYNFLDSDDYYLTCGQLTNEKQSIDLINYFKVNQKLKLVVLSNENYNSDFSNLIILKKFTPASVLLRSAIKGAKGFIEFGLYPPGISILEAACLNSSLYFHHNEWCKEFFNLQFVTKQYKIREDFMEFNFFNVDQTSRNELFNKLSFKNNLDLIELLKN